MDFFVYNIVKNIQILISMDYFPFISIYFFIYLRRYRNEQGYSKMVQQ